MIGSSPPRSRASSSASPRPTAPVRDGRGAWVDLLPEGTAHCELELSDNEALVALVDHGRIPATPEDCAAIVYWCSLHDAEQLLDRLLDEWPADVKTLKLTQEAASTRASQDPSTGPRNTSPGALERTTCRVLEKLAAGGLEEVSLRDLVFDDDASGRLAAAVQASSSLASLSIMCPEEVRAVAEPSHFLDAAAASGSLRCLRLQQDLGEGAAVHHSLASLITQGRLTTLELKGSNFSVETARTIGKALSSSTCAVTTLGLNECFQDAAGVGCVIEALRRNASVEVLNLSNNDLGAAMQPLHDLLYASDRLTHLRLANTHPDGVMLGQALAKNRTLVSLDLSINDLSEVGALVAGLKGNTVLKSLDLSAGLLKEVDGVHLGALLRDGALESLDLSDNSLRSEGLDPLFDALGSNASLTRLELRGVLLNKVSDAMVAGLGRNRNLAQLDLRNNVVIDWRLGDLFGALANNRIALQLPGDDLQGAQLEDLASALSENSGIKALTIDPGVRDEPKLMHELASRLESNFTLTGLAWFSSSKFPNDSVESRNEAKINWVLWRNGRIRQGVERCFERFAEEAIPRLPAELGRIIGQFLEGDNAGERARLTMRRVLLD